MNKTNQTKEKRSFSKNNKQSKKSTKFKKQVTIILIVIIAVVGSYFLMTKNKLGNGKSDNIQIHSYYSRGSRDTNRVEQDVFKVNDPIQIKVDFKDMENGDILNVSLRKKGNEEVKQLTELPVSEGEGSRFVSISQLVRKEVGKYEVEISITKNGKDKVLATKEFEIQ